LPTHVEIGTESGLQMSSIALIEQNMLVSKNSLIKKIGEADSKVIKKIDIALLVQFGLLEKIKKVINKNKVAVV
jgi:mRNA-degrading endonuclease toxin of MazEF toxin-antitoxin module